MHISDVGQMTACSRRWCLLVRVSHRCLPPISACDVCRVSPAFVRVQRRGQTQRRPPNSHTNCGTVTQRDTSCGLLESRRPYSSPSGVGALRGQASARGHAMGISGCGEFPHALGFLLALRRVGSTCRAGPPFAFSFFGSPRVHRCGARTAVGARSDCARQCPACTGLRVERWHASRGTTYQVHERVVPSASSALHEADCSLRAMIFHVYAVCGWTW